MSVPSSPRSCLDGPSTTGKRCLVSPHLGLDAGYPQDAAGSFLCNPQLHRENTPCDKSLFSVNSSGPVVGGQARSRHSQRRRLGTAGVGRWWLPRRPQRRAPTAAQPPSTLAGGPALGFALPWQPPPAEPHLYDQRIDLSGHHPHAGAEGPASSLPPSSTQEKQKPDHAEMCKLQTLPELCRERAARSPAWRPVGDPPGSPFPRRSGLSAGGGRDAGLRETLWRVPGSADTLGPLAGTQRRQM